MEDQPNGFFVIIDGTTDVASVGEKIVIKVQAVRDTSYVENVAVFVTAEGSAHVIDTPDPSRISIADDIDDVMGSDKLRGMLESMPILSVGKKTNVNGRADFLIHFDRPGDARINILWLNPDKKAEESEVRLVTVFGEEVTEPVVTKFVSVSEMISRRQLSCDADAPDSVSVGSPATVRVRVHEGEKAESGIMVTLVPKSDNIQVLLAGDNRVTVPSDSGMTDNNGTVNFQIAQRIERRETVGYTIEWDNNGTVDKIERSIAFAQKKEEAAMRDDESKDSLAKAPVADIESPRSEFKRWWPVGAIVLVAAFLVTVLVVSSQNEWSGWNEWFGGKDTQDEADDSLAALTKVEAVPDPVVTEPVVAAPTDAEASDAAELEAAAAAAENNDMVITVAAEAVPETDTGESSPASEEPEIYTWYSTDGVLEVYNPKLVSDLEQGKKDANRVQDLLVENSDLSDKVTELHGQVSTLEGQVSSLESQAGKKTFVIPKRIKCKGEDYTVHGGWITIHDCEPVTPKK